MAQDREATHRAEDLRRELFGLARTEREIRREIGAKILCGESVIALRALRFENMEAQEDLSAAVNVLEGSSL